MRHYSIEVKVQYKEVKKVDVNDNIFAFNTIAMFNWSNVVSLSSLQFMCSTQCQGPCRISRNLVSKQLYNIWSSSFIVSYLWEYKKYCRIWNVAFD